MKATQFELVRLVPPKSRPKGIGHRTPSANPNGGGPLRTPLHSPFARASVMQNWGHRRAQKRPFDNPSNQRRSSATGNWREDRDFILVLNHGVPVGRVAIYPDFAGWDQRREMVAKLVASRIDHLARSRALNRD